MEQGKFYIDENATVLEAMQEINENGLKTLFVVENRKLRGSVTDGDTRRWIVRGGDINAPVKNIVNYNPKYLNVKSKTNPVEFMRKNKIEAVPIVNDDMEICEIVSWAGRKGRQYKGNVDLPVVIMAGGKGTRLQPYTKILPKPLIPIGDLPILEIIINEFCKYQCKEFFTIVNYKKNMIKAYFNEIKKSYDLIYIDEEKPLGTGGGLSLLKGQIQETFILTNCDILVTADIESIYKLHKKKKNLITMVCCNKLIEVPYGVIEVDEDGSMKEMVEKPQLPFLTNTGLYIVEPIVIEQLNTDEYIGFPDIIRRYMEAGKPVGVYIIEEDEWLDMGQPEELERMRDYLEEEGDNY